MNSSSRATTAVVSGVLFYAMTVLCGFAVSLIGGLGSPGAWWLASSIVAVLTILVRRVVPPPSAGVRSPLSFVALPGCSPWVTAGLALGFATVAAIVVVDLILVSRVAPHTWDVMVYHLTRMGYFVQQGSLAWYPANYWSQVQHAKDSAILDTLVYLAFFRQDSFIQAIQLAAYLLAGAATYSIARLSGAGLPAALVAALVFLLGTNAVLESSTAQNDLLVTSCLAACLMFLLLFIEQGRPAWLLLVAAALGLAIGTKASALGVVPGLALLAAAAGVKRRRSSPLFVLSRRQWVGSGLAGVLIMGALILPAGYLDNYLRYGHPLGDRQVRLEHTFQGHPPEAILHESVLNVGRLIADSLRLEGLPARSVADRVGACVQSILRSLLTAMGIELGTAPTGVPFGLGIESLGEATPSEWSFVGMHEDWSFLGPMNLLLILPTALLGCFLCWRQPLFWGSLAAGVALLVVMAARPYQPFLGRFFSIFPVLMAPALALTLDRLVARPLSAIWICLALTLGAVSAGYAVRYRSVSPFPEVLALPRIERLTSQRPEIADVLKRFEQQVPDDATVICVLRGDSYEYPFFGNGMTRTLIPGGEWPSLPPAPTASPAQFLLFNDHVVPAECDVELGDGYRLRNLATCAR